MNEREDDPFGGGNPGQGPGPENPDSFFAAVQRKLDAGEPLDADEVAAAEKMGMAPRTTAFPAPEPPPSESPLAPPEEQPAQAPAQDENLQGPGPTTMAEVLVREEADKPKVAEYVDPFEALKQLPDEARLERLERQLAAHKAQWLAVLSELGRATGREEALDRILAQKPSWESPQPPEPAE